MKTYLTKLSVLCLIFLISSFFKAQGEEVYPYHGGNADGFATETIENATCSIPFHHYAYFGGNGDGFASETLENATCSTPFHQYAYFGGDADGFALETLEINNCSTPYHFYAYFGGNGDGFAKDKTTDVCPINPPVADFTADKTTICVGQSVQFTDVSTNMPTGWNWTFEGGTPSAATTKTVTITYNTPGVYQVKLTAINYNGSDTKTKIGFITVVSDCGTLGVSNSKIHKTLIYPNPTKNILFIKSKEDIKNVEIFDTSGKKIMNIKSLDVGKENRINIEHLSAGVYILKIYSAMQIETFKVIQRD
ncbi:MAG: hypothetical protein DI529_12655 [Chryseobacterium sp.]|nr:MAG: hypothetical protein DI529_12655 [Chryseobacterium sp.]